MSLTPANNFACHQHYEDFHVLCFGYNFTLLIDLCLSIASFNAYILVKAFTETIDKLITAGYGNKFYNLLDLVPKIMEPRFHFLFRNRKKLLFMLHF
jgi:hypothetical protein